MQLTARLSAIAGLIPAGSVVVDVGTDHARLPVYLVRSGICPRALATEINRQPWQRARAAVAEAGLSDKIAVRLGDGLAPLRPGEADVAVLAGMGGGTICRILQTAPPGVLAGLQRLVLQPMADVGALRLFLAQTGYALVREELVEEGGQLYPVLAAGPGQEPCTDRLLLELGPRLYEQRHPLLAHWLVRELAGLDRALAGLGRARQRDARWEQRVARLAERRARIHSILEELPQ